jgi:hypothetical protein
MAMEPCCAKPENLEEKPNTRPDIILKVCKVCGRKHYEFNVDTIQLGLKGNSLDG